MLKNYFTTAINNLLKNKLHSAINIIGLAIGLAACLIITLYVQNELSYDKHWEKADLIYRINRGDSPDNLGASTSMLALPALKKYFPEDIEFGTRIRKRGHNEEIQIGDTRYPASIPFVDKEFINIFQVDEIKGSLESTLQSPGNIPLSQESAAKYFGEKDPIGEMIPYISGNGNKEPFQVTAVYRNISPNTILNLSAFSLFNETTMAGPYWFANSVETYIRLSDKADYKSLLPVCRIL
jgi:putative ABC transport system permease protein